VNWTRWILGAVLGKRLVRIDGSVHTASRHSLTIRRDRYGVAYVDAADEAGAWFGLGFCHGQDRAGQLEVLLRIARGTLAEVVGPEAIGVDRALRQLGLHRAGTAQLETLDADIRDQISAYVQGLNDALQHEVTPRSHEHVLLRIEPSLWTPADVMALGLVTCCFLPSNWDVELARLAMFMADGEAAVRALDPTFPAELPLTSPPGKPAGLPELSYLAEDLQTLRNFIGHAGGSNAWAVSASRTLSGRPLLANDPHLPTSLPNIGYLARVGCPAFAVAGFSLVGVPVFISGHNGHVAWGSTAAMVDNADLFLEELSADGSCVREGDAFVPCEARTEFIRVRGQPTEALRVRVTPRGPIVTRVTQPELALFERFSLPGRANAISLAATWLEARPTRALLGFHAVRSFAEFRLCCAASAACTYGIVYADPNNIGWTLATEVPRRKTGYGSLPLPGWHAEVGWEAQSIGGAEMPSVHNPAEGYVSCANNQPAQAHPDTPFLGHDFLDGYRQARITEQLSSRSDWTVHEMSTLQVDVTSLVFRQVREVVLAAPALDDASARGLELLTRWDGNVSADSVGASVFDLLLVELCRRACRVRAPNSWEVAVGAGVVKLIPGTCWNARRASFTAQLLVEQPDGFFASWPREIASCLSSVVGDLRLRFGDDERDWAWGRIRPLPLEHRFGKIGLLGPTFNRGPLTGYGDGTTVNQAGLEFYEPLRHSTVAAVARSIIDVGDWGASRFVLLGGQSGNPFSPHYADLVPPWERGEAIPIHWDGAAIALNTVATLELIPDGKVSTTAGGAS